MTARSCGEVIYETRVIARRGVRKDPPPDVGTTCVYRCTICRWWHIGTDADAHRAVGGRLYAPVAGRRRVRGGAP